MDNFDEFFNIGVGFANSKTTDVVKEIPDNDIPEYTSDGRRKDKFSIVVEPNENIPIPDTSNNGVVSTEDVFNIFCREELVRDRYKEYDLRIVLAKSQFNNITNILQSIRSKLTNSLSKLLIGESEKTVCSVLLKNAILSDSETTISNSYKEFDSDNFCKIFKEYFENIRNINFLDTSTINLDKLKSLNTQILNINDLSHALKIGEIFDIDKYNPAKCVFKIIDDLKICQEIILNIDFNELCNRRCLDIKENFGKFDENGIVAVSEAVNILYIYGVRLSKFINTLTDDITKFMYYITPIDHTIISIDHSKLISLVEKVDPWLSADYHLLKELGHGGEDIQRTLDIIKIHNSVVKPNDLFFFLGDISESEFYDRKLMNLLQKLIPLVRQLNGKKIILTGNNDTMPDSMLKEMGFLEVYRDPIILKKHIFSHGPTQSINGLLNVHGHIHGNKSYWNLDFRNHIDVFYGLYGHPVKLSYLDKESTLIDYYNGCITKTKEDGDPSVGLPPSNIVK